ncbi:MAG TPA: hypothetical protein VFA60_02120 [Terriglobales bacterium]|nr:hypothetical protein [Terriglobales bacterium]
MECPKCHFDHPLQPADTCLRCGIVFSRYAATAAAAAAAPSGAGAAPAVALERPEPPLSADELAEIQKKARHELTCRVFALPGALLLGWLTASAMPMLAGFLRMWTHESGHAITAWLCGYVAIPTAWFTIIFPGRQRGLSLLLAAGLAFGGYVAWQRKRWFWVATTAAALVLLLLGGTRTDYRAQGLITFGGDAGSFFVSTILMATFYARPESAMVRRQLRWVLLVFGAIAFMDAYATWSGGFEKIAEWLEDAERGPSDLMQLTQYYGWPIGEMQRRFLSVAHWCFFALAAMYAAGIVQARQRKSAVAP